MNFANLRAETKRMLGLAFIAAIVLLVSALSLRSLGGSNGRLSSALAGVGTRERIAGEIHAAFA